MVDEGVLTAVEEVSPKTERLPVLAIVRAPLIWEMVEEVERKLLFVSSPPTVTLPLRVVIVADAVLTEVEEASP